MNRGDDEDEGQEENGGQDGVEQNEEGDGEEVNQEWYGPELGEGVAFGATAKRDHENGGVGGS